MVRLGHVWSCGRYYNSCDKRLNFICLLCELNKHCGLYHFVEKFFKKCQQLLCKLLIIDGVSVSRFHICKMCVEFQLGNAGWLTADSKMIFDMAVQQADTE